MTVCTRVCLTLISVGMGQTFLMLVSAEGLFEVFPDCALLDCSINAQLLQVVRKGAVPVAWTLLLVKEVLAPLTPIILWYDSL